VGAKEKRFSAREKAGEGNGCQKDVNQETEFKSLRERKERWKADRGGTRWTTQHLIGGRGKGEVSRKAKGVSSGFDDPKLRLKKREKEEGGGRSMGTFIHLSSGKGVGEGRKKSIIEEV